MPENNPAPFLPVESQVMKMALCSAESLQLEAHCIKLGGGPASLFLLTCIILTQEQSFKLTRISFGVIMDSAGVLIFAGLPICKIIRRYVKFQECT